MLLFFFSVINKETRESLIINLHVAISPSVYIHILYNLELSLINTRTTFRFPEDNPLLNLKLYATVVEVVNLNRGISGQFTSLNLNNIILYPLLEDDTALTTVGVVVAYILFSSLRSF